MVFVKLAVWSTMTGATPPCSNAQRTPGASLLFSHQPTLAEPTKLKKPISGLVTNTSATSLSQTHIWHHASGRPAA